MPARQPDFADLFHSDEVLENPVKLIRKFFTHKALGDKGLTPEVLQAKSDPGIQQLFAHYVARNRDKIKTLQGPKSAKSLKPQSLVRVVGMHQEGAGNEYVIGAYDVVDSKTKEVVERRSAVFEELTTVEVPEGQEVAWDAACLVDRRSIRVVKIPYQSDWVSQETSPTPKGWKSNCDVLVRLWFDMALSGGGLKLNAACEFIGVWTPAKDGEPHILNALCSYEIGSGFPLCPSIEMNKSKWDEEICALKPQAEAIRKELLEIFTKVLDGDAMLAKYVLLHMMSTVRSPSSKAHLRVGYMVFNVTRVPHSREDDDDSWAQKFKRLYELLLPKVQMHHLSLKQLNQASWVPFMEGGNEQLKMTKLQCTPNTFLILNNTALTEGQLKGHGIPNMTALAKLITEQQLDYKFIVHSLPFKTAMPTILLSEGKSMLPMDAQIAFKKNRGAEDPSGIKDLLSSMLGGSASGAEQHGPGFVDTLFKEVNPVKLALWRKYILLCRQLGTKISLSESCSKLAQRWFAAERQRAPGKPEMDAKVFHYKLNLARAVAQSLGEESVEIKHFNEMRNLERDRIESLPPPAKKKAAEAPPAGGAAVPEPEEAAQRTATA